MQTTAMIVALLLVISVTLCSSLKCHTDDKTEEVCDSEVKYCMKIFDQKSDKTLRKCDGDGSVPHPSYCVNVGGTCKEQQGQKLCCCDKDLCNGATILQHDHFLPIIATLIVCLFLFRR